MEELARAARERGYLLPPSKTSSLEKLRSYLEKARLEDLSVEGLRRLARENALQTSGLKADLINRLVPGGVRPPPVTTVPQMRPSSPSRDQSPIRPIPFSLDDDSSSSSSPKFEPLPFNGEACLVEWSDDYRKQYAEYYGVSPRMSAPEICATLEALQYDIQEKQTFRITVPGRGTPRELTWPLSAGLSRDELDTIARRTGTYVTPGMSDAALLELLNRVVGVESTVRINYELPPMVQPPLVFLPLPVFEPSSNVRLPVSNENLPVVPGCFNRDVPTASIGERYIDESGHTYCFNRDEMVAIRDSGINPYTGKPLRPDFIGKAPPALQRECTPCPNGADKPCYNTTPLTPEASTWLRNWMGPGVFGKHKAVYYIPPAIRLTLAKYKRCEPIVVYRGLHFTDQEYRDYVTYNRRDVFAPITLNSWTTARSTAENYSGRVGTYSILMKATLRPEDIFVDLNVAEKVVRALGGQQSEVIALPGRYQVEVLNDNGPKDVGMVAPVRVADVPLPSASASASSSSPVVKASSVPASSIWTFSKIPAPVRQPPSTPVRQPPSTPVRQPPPVPKKPDAPRTTSSEWTFITVSR